MIIRDLNIKRVRTFPFETNPPLIIDSNTILSYPVTASFFESIRWWNSQVVDIDGIVDHTEFSQSHLLNVRWQFTRLFALIDFLCLIVFEGFDHANDYIVRRTKCQAINIYFSLKLKDQTAMSKTII
jgi:hypothetical protein